MPNDLRTALLCLAALAAAVVVAGCTADAERSSRTDSGAVQTLPEDEALALPEDEALALPEDDALAAPPAEPTPTGGMDEATFWALIAEARQGAEEDTDERSHRLQELLTQLPPEAIVEFERTRRSLDLRAYTWELWGAAYVVEDGCSDDCFRDFRAYLISLGREPYEAGLRDPDSLADVVAGRGDGRLGECRQRRRRGIRERHGGGLPARRQRSLGASQRHPVGLRGPGRPRRTLPAPGRPLPLTPGSISDQPRRR